jgi:hypothetical protein
VEGDLAVGLAAIHNGHHLYTLGGVDGGVVAQVVWASKGSGEVGGQLGRQVFVRRFRHHA